MKLINVIENGFPPQNETHTAKFSFSGVLKHFHGYCLNNSLLVQKSDCQK